jgi:hypothetical protein
MMRRRLSVSSFFHLAFLAASVLREGEHRHERNDLAISKLSRLSSVMLDQPSRRAAEFLIARGHFRFQGGVQTGTVSLVFLNGQFSEVRIGGGASLTIRVQ